MPLTPGSTFERYEIQSLIGRGGMGEVYRAIDTRLHRPVALKVLRTDKDGSATVTEAGGVARLLREARAAAALNHPNSVAIYELGEAEGIPYIAMELVTGTTLRRYAGEGNVSVETKVGWLVDVARALWAAHRAGLIHRDVKPGNIMVSEDGIVKVLDFGLAKPTAIRARPDEFQTLGGQVLGTPRYMAPEQLEGATPDASADQYAFGLTAYELISGEYAGGPLAGDPKPLHQRMPGVSPELGQVVARLMARVPSARFPTLEAAAHALRGCLGATPRSPEEKARAPVRLEVADDDGPASNAPTVVRPPQDAQDGQDAQEESASAVQEVAGAAKATGSQGATLPLGVPFRMAIGDRAAARPSQAPALGKTMPLGQVARPLGLPPAALPPSTSLPPAAPGAQASGAPSSGASGVQAVRTRALPETKRSADPRGIDPSRKSSTLWVVLLALLAFVAVAATAALAWRHR